MKKLIVILIVVVLVTGCNNPNTTINDKSDKQDDVVSRSIQNNELSKVSINLFTGNRDNYEYVNSYIAEPIYGEGFVYKVDPTCFLLEIMNQSDDMLELEIGYRIKTYKNMIEFGIDKADIVNYESVVHEIFEGRSEIDTLSPGEGIDTVIFSAETFPYIDIEVTEVIVNGEQEEYNVEILKYMNDEFNYLQDNYHLLKMLGVVSQ